MVTSKVLEDDEVIKQRQELIRSKSPAELSEIHGLDDIPVPGFVEHSMDSLKRMGSRSRERKEGEGGLKGMYDKVPETFKTQLLVKATVEDPEIQAQRAELIKEKSVNELSQVTSFSEFPVPDTIERLASRQGAVERKKRFREKQKSLSVKSLNEMMPDSFKSQLLVKAKVEKPEVQKERAELVSTKSVSELSQVTSLSEFPIPTTIETLIEKGRNLQSAEGDRSAMSSPSQIKDNIYATLPRSLKSELAVTTKIQDPEVVQERHENSRSRGCT